jgi:epoxyqueuosine reductase
LPAGGVNLSGRQNFYPDIQIDDTQMDTNRQASLTPESNTGSLEQAIKAEARRLGFGLVGITTPQPPAHLAAYEAWLQSGQHGEMGYLATDRAQRARANPLQLLPECRSILVLGMRYAANPLPEPAAIEPAPTPAGKIASYAWGADYHDVLPVKLKSLVDFIEAQVGASVPNRWYTDTGPILERDLAQRAGLGWIGKNTCLINPRQGSYFLLAEILLALELRADAPITIDHCGRCTRCLEACPTACILPNRTLDARRCIAYLTIELKGAVPLDLRPQIGEWVFGCDICQQVCPWNRRFADVDDELDLELQPRPGVPEPDLIDELSLSREAFNAKFRGSPVRRSKRRGYLRNVAVALGNSANPAALPAMARVVANEPEALVRSHAAWALGQIGGEGAHQALTQACLAETEPLVLVEIQAALEQMDVPDRF